MHIETDKPALILVGTKGAGLTYGELQPIKDNLHVPDEFIWGIGEDKYYMNINWRVFKKYVIDNTDSPFYAGWAKAYDAFAKWHDRIETLPELITRYKVYENKICLNSSAINEKDKTETINVAIAKNKDNKENSTTLLLLCSQHNSIKIKKVDTKGMNIILSNNFNLFELFKFGNELSYIMETNDLYLDNNGDKVANYIMESFSDGKSIKYFTLKWIDDNKYDINVIDI